MTPDLVLVQFDPAHLRLMQFSRPEMQSMERLGSLTKYVARINNGDPAYTLFDRKGLIVASAGLHVLWPGVGEGWAILSSLADNYMFSIHSLVKNWIDKLTAIYQLHRLQISVPDDSERAYNWACRLGFHGEGKMKKYGPDGKDYFRFARIT